MAAASMLVVGSAAASSGAAPAADPATPVAPSAPLGQAKLDASARDLVVPTQVAEGRTAYFVQLSGQGAAQVAGRSASPAKGAQAAKARREAINTSAARVVSSARKADGDAAKIFVTTNSLPGVGVLLDGKGVAALADNPDVVSVKLLPRHTLSNSSAASLSRAVNAWRYAGNTGQGVKIGIIDTGIDYTHADFGGPGTTDAFDAAAADSTAYNWRAGLDSVGQAKVVGGYDFAGDDYNADPASPSYQPIPDVDTNPLDCNGHGTHVAGTAAGYGVGAGGKTYTGDYAKLKPGTLKNMTIGPGMAPDAELYGLRVFGCEGSTNVVLPALDWALDPNGDGKFNDHLDIVNLSLGSDYAPQDNPENDVVDELASHGVLSVIAAGNNGDLTDTGGEPGNAVSSLAVASSVDALQQRDGLTVNAPDGDAGIVAGQMSVAYNWPENGPTGEPVTGDVVTIPGANADGCTPLSPADAALVAGKVAWLEWDDNDATRACGSVGRAANVKAAGAIGSIFTSGLDVFGAGITGDPDIPVFQLPKAGTDKLRDAAEAGTLNVTFDGDLQSTIKDVTTSIIDTISSFTSRGTHGSYGVVKPDVAMVGDTVSSASVGTGNKVLTESGTSMATPGTAGIAALVKAAHPVWGPLAVKAAVMNTAGHDLYTDPDRSGDRYGPNRVGAGRADAYSAIRTKVLAFAQGPGLNPISASFGPVSVPIDGGVVVKKQKVDVANGGAKPVTVDLAYDPVIESPGVSYSVSSDKLRVGPGKHRTVVVKMTIDPTQLRHTIDPTMDVDQTNVYYGDDEARQFVSDASGRLLVTPQGKKSLRVPVYGAAKPASTTTATFSDADGGAISLAGAGFATGDSPEDYTSLTSVLQLGATSPRLPECDDAPADGCATLPSQKAADLHYVGAGVSQGALTFGLSTFGEWATIGNTTIPYVDYDVDGDGVADYETYLQNITGTDLLYAWTVDFDGGLYDLEPVNLLSGATDSNVFDSDAVTMSVFLDALPEDLGEITYTVGMFDAAYGTTVDESDPVTFDVTAPTIATDGPLYVDEGDTSIGLTGSRAEDAEALVLHLHGESGKRAEVVEVPAAAPAR